MQITKIKQWDKSQNGEVVNHVEIHYSEGVKNIILHDTRKASPEFYKLFKELSPLTIRKHRRNNVLALS
jgi:hypothetical protein